MRLFQKPCANPNDVLVEDGGAGGGGRGRNYRNKQKKNSNKNLLTTDQYEYVRREFGYDFVPPSQYVPSQSFDDDDEDDYDEGYDAYPNTGHYHDNRPMPYQHHAGPVPVRVVEPKSELSQDIDRAFDDFSSRPKPLHTYGKRTTSGKMRDDGDVVVVKRALPAPAPKKIQLKCHHPPKRHPRPQRKTPPREMNHYCSAHHYHAKVDDDNMQQSQLREHRPTHSGNDSRRQVRSTRRSERQAQQPRRPLASPRDIQEPPTPRKIKSFPEEDLETDDLDIPRVHTAYSYNSNDSAEGYLEEQSRGSRYMSSSRKEKKNTRRETASPRNSTGGSRSRVVEEERDDHVDVEAVPYHPDTLEQRRSREREEQSHSSKLEDFERPRFDRQKKEYRLRQDEVASMPRRSHSSAREDRRVDGFEFEKKRVVSKRNVKEKGREHYPSQAHGRSRRHRHMEEIEAERRIVDRVSSEEFEVEVEHVDFEPYHEDIRRSISEQYRGQESYYATQSGIASDVKFVETRKLEQKSRSKSLFGKIRDSVRGSTAKKVDNRSGAGFRRRKDQGKVATKSKAKQSAPPIFEQIPPSIQSDVSFDRPRQPRILQSEIDQPREKEYAHCGGHQRKHDQEYQQRRQPRVLYDQPSEQHYMIEDYEREKIRRQLSPEQEEEYDDYWGATSGEYSAPSPQSYRPYPRQQQNVSPPEQFEFFQSETPPLRANPDHRRVPVATTMARRHPNPATPDYYYPHSPAEVYNLPPYSQSLVQPSSLLVDNAFPKPKVQNNNSGKGFALFRCA